MHALIAYVRAHTHHTRVCVCVRVREVRHMHVRRVAPTQHTRARAPASQFTTRASPSSLQVWPAHRLRSRRRHPPLHDAD
jgi:hypothetical protein